MKKYLFGLLGLIALVAAFAAPATTHAASGATCWSDPARVYIKDNVTIYCRGFSPNTTVNAYYVEPDGAAATLGSGKTDQYGEVNISLDTYMKEFPAGLAVGDWTVVVEQTGLAKSVLARGEAKFHVIGGKEGVSGAKLWSSTKSVAPQETAWLYGSGFAPYEMVSFWWEYPNGDCSSFTYHDYIYNNPGFRGFSSFGLDTVKADAAGNVTFPLGFNATACEGNYRVVARGNSSGWGAETWLGLHGNKVSTSAWLSASPNKVMALFDWVYFKGWGFAANEHVSCWVTTPHSQVTSVDQWWQPTVKADAGGNISFSIYTGWYFPPFPYGSEGALGTYSMTCRGDSSKATAIGTFMVTGNPVVDP